MTPSKEDRFDLFLAHASDDRDAFVGPLVNALRGRGMSVWYSQFDSPFSASQPASDDALHEFLSRAMEMCSAGIVVVSPRFLEKPWPKRELEFWTSDIGRRKKLFYVLHGTGLDEVIAVAGAVVKTIATPDQTLATWMGAKEIAGKVVNAFGKRALLVQMQKLPGPTDIAVFPDEGIVCIGYSGGLMSSAPGAKMEFLDFSGKRITDRSDKILGVLWRQVERLSGVGKVDDRGWHQVEGRGFLKGQSIHFDEDILYAHFNHLHCNFFTPEQVKRGALFNMGTNAKPRVMSPFYTCDCYTGGVVNEEVEPFVQQCLKIAKGSYKGNWQKFVVNEDRKSFSVSGEE